MIIAGKVAVHIGPLAAKKCYTAGLTLGGAASTPGVRRTLVIKISSRSSINFQIGHVLHQLTTASGNVANLAYQGHDSAHPQLSVGAKSPSVLHLSSRAMDHRYAMLHPAKIVSSTRSTVSRSEVRTSPIGKRNRNGDLCGSASANEVLHKSHRSKTRRAWEYGSTSSSVPRRAAQITTMAFSEFNLHAMEALHNLSW